MTTAPLHALALALAAAPNVATLPAPAQDPAADERARLEAAFREQGVELSVAGRWCAIPVEVCIREDLLEYLLVAPHGAAHESLFVTGVPATVLQTALIALGAEAGTNAEWIQKDPPPSEEELAQGVSPYEVSAPTGTGFRMSVAWRQAGEGEDDEYFFRVEDLIGNLRTGRSLQRHEWTYLGSRLVPPRPDAPPEAEVLAAELEGNLVNLSWFRAGNTLLTAALPECIDQTIWLPNAYLVPPRGAQLTLLLHRDPLRAVPEALRAALPVLAPPSEPAGDGRRRGY